MIMFDLDGTLADCDHRMHFVTPPFKNCGFCQDIINMEPIEHIQCLCGQWPTKWKPNWKSFYEACDKDNPITETIEILIDSFQETSTKIWSGRCESVREKTMHWLQNETAFFLDKSWLMKNLKMRPIGDNTPDDQLKERWLNEQCSDLMEAKIEGRNPVKHNIDFVFDSNPKSIAMWRRRGIFVFNCGQYDEEF